jgi:hypothetical protein
VYTWPDGRRYEGEFKDGERQGRGAHTHLTIIWPLSDHHLTFIRPPFDRDTRATCVCACLFKEVKEGAAMRTWSKEPPHLITLWPPFDQ